MGKIFYIMGKSASGKDTIYKELIEKMPKFLTIQSVESGLILQQMMDRLNCGSMIIL